MLNVTDPAAALLHESLEASKKNEADVLRLTRSPQGLALALDEEREGDQVILHEERKVLVIQPEMAQALDGATIDAVDTPAGRQLAIQSPEPH